MPTFEVWDTVKLPFPYKNRPVVQRRPALVVAVGAKPAMPILLWVLMITSAENRGWPGDVALDDGREAGLPVASVVRTAKVATVEADAAAPIGRLPQRARPAVASQLHDLLRTTLAV